jgi:shikimate kinase
MEKVIENIDFSSRPLLQKNKTKIFDIFEQRKEKYESASDIKIDNCTTIEDTVRKIISLNII